MSERKVSPDGSLVYENLDFHEGFIIGDSVLLPDNRRGIVTSITWFHDRGTLIVVESKSNVSPGLAHYRADELVNLDLEDELSARSKA